MSSAVPPKSQAIAPILPTRGLGGSWLLGWAALALVLVFFFSVPFWVIKPYVLHMGVLLFLAIIQGQAWNILGGYAGQHSLGHAAYFGVGAYSTMMLLEVKHVQPLWGIWVGVLLAAAVSWGVGAITFRLRGPYFVLASISVAEIVRLLALELKGFTRGAEGFLLSTMPSVQLGPLEIDFIGKRPFYFAALVVALLTTWLSWGIRRSKIGYYLLAVREDQDAAHSIGINLQAYKCLALVLSAACTAWAGGFYALFVKFIDPDTVFGMDVSVQILLTCIVGGIGTLLGPALGAFLLVPLSELLRNPKGLAQLGLIEPDSAFIRVIEERFSNAHSFAYGLLLVVIILFAPEGLFGVGARLWRRAAARGAKS
ncbi:MAG: branched-chain amino acid ABC transporter permease [Polyangiales bacterium]